MEGKMNNSRPLVWAHRGASGYAPENTLPAFQKAVDMSADGVELDIQMTSDGHLVVCHDEKIDRTSNKSGLLKDFTLAELKEMDFSNGMMDYKGTKISTMEEVFDLLKNTNLTINIELKTGIFFYPGIEEAIINLTKSFNLMDRVIFSSFNHYTIMKIKELYPDSKCGFLYSDGIIDMPNYAKAHGVEALHPALYNIKYPNFIRSCRNKNLEVNVWTVNEENYMLMCCQAGVNAIITNYPDKAFEAIEKYLKEDK